MRLGLIAVVVMMASGCGEVPQAWSHLKSSALGLNRTVTLYANDGKEIKSWSGTFNIQDQGGSFRFVTDEGKAIQLAGTVLIEEK